MIKLCCLFIVSLVNVADSPQWLQVLQTKMQHIDHEAKLTKELIFEDTEKEFYCQRTYKMGKMLKLESEMYWKGNFTIGVIAAFYVEHKKVITYTGLWTHPYIYKGQRQLIDPIGNIREEQEYYKNETEGVRFSREIEYFTTEEIDSLKRVLKTFHFDEIALTNKDYLKRLEHYNRIKKLRIICAKKKERKRERANQKHLRYLKNW